MGSGSNKGNTSCKICNTSNKDKRMVAMGVIIIGITFFFVGTPINMIITATRMIPPGKKNNNRNHATRTVQ